MSEYDAVRDAMEDALNTAEYRQCFSLAVKDAMESAQIDQLQKRVAELEGVCEGIGAWLSASLSEGQPCQEYIDACNAVFKATKGEASE